MDKAKPVVGGAYAQRGYQPRFREGETNYCPACERSHWFVGRVTAECAFCTTALPFADTPGTGQSAQIVRMDRFMPTASHGRFTVNGQH